MERIDDNDRNYKVLVMTDMTRDVFAEQDWGKRALQKLGSVPQNFRLYHVQWLDGNREMMKITGAEFRKAKSGPSKGKLCVIVHGTQRSVYVSAEEMNSSSVNVR